MTRNGADARVVLTLAGYKWKVGGGVMSRGVQFGWGSVLRSYGICAPFPLFSIVMPFPQKSDKWQFVREDARET